MNRNRTLSRSTLVAAAAMLAGSLAFAQSSLTAPNNSAGSPLDTPPAGMAPAQAAPPATAIPSDPPLTTAIPSDANAPPVTIVKPTGKPTQTDSALVTFLMLDTANRGYLIRDDVAQLPGFVAFDQADRNRDGRLDGDEFQRAWADHGSSSGQ